MIAARLCPQCGAGNASWVLTTRERSAKGRPFRVIQCAHCSLRYTSPLPAAQDLSASYDESYYAGCISEPGGLGLLRSFLRRSVLQQRDRALLSRTPGRILDFGCGTGDFLAMLKARGWEVHGVELSDSASRLARAKGVTVYQGEDAFKNFPVGYFDAVTMWHVLEHLPAPLDSLADIHRILRQDGLLIVEVPNSDSWAFQLCKCDWACLDVPLHLQHFTPATLAAMLVQSGFSPVRRQDFHPWDVIFDWNSVLNRLGVGRRLGVQNFSTDYERVSAGNRALFGTLGALVAALSVPGTFLGMVMSGNSATVTLTSRRAATKVLHAPGSTPSDLPRNR